MARGGVKLSIYSTFDSKGINQADKAVKSFTRRFGELDEATGLKGITSAQEKMVRMSVGLDQTAAKLGNASRKAKAFGSTMTKNVTVPMGMAAAAQSPQQ